MASKHFQNPARREWWSIHLEAWRRSGLTQRLYCRSHRLAEATFSRWLRVLDGEKALRVKVELEREERRERRRRRKFPLSSDRRSQAVQAFWAMHVEALVWSGMKVDRYAEALRISRHSLRHWRELFEAGEVEVDWRAHLHPSARPNLGPMTRGMTKPGPVESVLTDAAQDVRRPLRRAFSAEEKLAIVTESAHPGVTVSSVARRHGVAVAVLFRWRAKFGVAGKEAVQLAPVELRGRRGDRGADAPVLHDLLRPPAGMAAVDLADGRRVFAPLGVDPEAVRRHIARREGAR